MPLFRQGSRLAPAKPVATINDAIPECGGQLIADTNSHTAPNPSGWSQVQVIAAATFATGTECNITGITGVAIPANAIIRGLFSVIKLTSGSVIAHNATD